MYIYIYGIYSDILADILSCIIYSDIQTDILSGFYLASILTNFQDLSGIYSDILSGILSAILSGMCSGPGVPSCLKRARDRVQVQACPATSMHLWYNLEILTWQVGNQWTKWQEN